MSEIQYVCQMLIRQIRGSALSLVGMLKLLDAIEKLDGIISR